MTTEAPTWADQWGEGGIGALDDVKPEEEKAVSDKKKAGFAGLKAKVASMVGMKWAKQKGQKKDPPK